MTTEQTTLDEIEAFCGHEHPLVRIMCIRTLGHDGYHWFTARWDDDGNRPPLPDDSERPNG